MTIVIHINKGDWRYHIEIREEWDHNGIWCCHWTTYHHDVVYEKSTFRVDQPRFLRSLARILIGED